MMMDFQHAKRSGATARNVEIRSILSPSIPGISRMLCMLFLVNATWAMQRIEDIEKFEDLAGGAYKKCGVTKKEITIGGKPRYVSSWDTVAKGSTCVVKKAQSADGKKFYAVKIITIKPDDPEANPVTEAEVKKEAHLGLEFQDSDKVVGFLAVGRRENKRKSKIFTDGKVLSIQYYFVMPWEDNGDMHCNTIKPLKDSVTKWNARNRVDECPLLTLAKCKGYIRAIFDSYMEFWKRKIAHCDMKPENILMRKRTGKDELPVISDLGFCIEVETNLEILTEIHGSLAFMSCDRLNSQPVTRHEDLWAIGVILYELVTGKYPFYFDKNLPKDFDGTEYDKEQLYNDRMRTSILDYADSFYTFSENGNGTFDKTTILKNFNSLDGSTEFDFLIDREPGFEHVRDLISKLLLPEIERIGYNEDHLQSIIEHKALQKELNDPEREKTTASDPQKIEKPLRGIKTSIKEGIVKERLKYFRNLQKTNRQLHSEKKQTSCVNDAKEIGKALRKIQIGDIVTSKRTNFSEDAGYLAIKEGSFADKLKLFQTVKPETSEPKVSKPKPKKSRLGRTMERLEREYVNAARRM